MTSNINTPVINQVRDAVIASLSKLVQQAVADAGGEIANLPATPAQKTTVNLFPEREPIARRFADKLRSYFDSLTGEKSRAVNLDYSSLSLVGEDDLEAIIAMEGMVAHSRNSDISQYIRFTMRMNSMFYGLDIDESNNPLDPEQIGDAFKEAMRPLALPAKQLLIVYRKFNTNVFHNLESVLEEANQILIDNDIIPNLDVNARNKKEQARKRNNERPTAVAEERAFADDSEKLFKTRSNPEMFSLMQNLMHGLAANVASAVPGGTMPMSGGGSFAAPAALTGVSGPAVMPTGGKSGMMIGGNRVAMVPQSQLIDILSDIQNRLATTPAAAGSAEPLNLGDTLGETLQASSEAGTVRAIDGQSADIINLVTLLYKAFWQDVSLPIPIKELLGRTQITILKIALADAEFFNKDQHAARVLLNELALAGIGWTEVERLENDPTYSEMQRIVLRMFNEFTGDISLFDTLLAEFREFKRQHDDSILHAEERLADADERRQRLDEIKSYVSRKIDERILDDQLDPLMDTILREHFHKFLVKLVLKEGPGGNGWKPVINTIDVLLWTVQSRKQQGDEERFRKINPRLQENLGKALRIAGLSKADTESLLQQLLSLQKESFSREAASTTETAATAGVGSEAAPVAAAAEPAPLPEDDEHLREVDKLPIGIWVEFQGTDDQSVRCTLAARIETIDKLVFVNRQGVKVVEKSRMGLARELKQGSVKIISDHPLFDRALETVISNLRDQQSQQDAPAETGTQSG